MERFYMDTLNVDLSGNSQGIIDLGEGRVQTIIPSFDLGTNSTYTVYLRPCKGNATETFSTESKYRIKADAVGLDFTQTELSNDHAHVVSSSAADITQTVTVYGSVYNTSEIVKVSVLLRGTTSIQINPDYPGTSQTWGAILGIEVDAAHAGTITVEEHGGTDVKTLATGTNSSGIVTPDAIRAYGMPVVGAAEAASIKYLGIWGHTTTGGETGEMITLAGTALVYTARSFVDVTKILVGDVENTSTVNVGTYGILLNHGIFPAADMGSDDSALQLHGTIRYIQYAVYSGTTLSPAGAADRLALAIYG